MKSTVGWDHCPGQLLVRDNGPKLRLVDLNLPLALAIHQRDAACKPVPARKGCS